MDNFERQLAVLVKTWLHNGAHPLSMTIALSNEIEAIAKMQLRQLDPQDSAGPATASTDPKNVET